MGLFLGSPHWPAGGFDLGVGGISFVELLIFRELWAGERLSLEKAHLRYLRPGRPISVSVFPFGPGIDIGLFVYCLVGFVGLFLALLGPIMVGFVILVGKGVVMVLLLGLVRVPLSLFFMSFWGSFSIFLDLGVLCLLVLFPFGIVLLALLAGLPLGGYRYLVMFLILSLLLLGLPGRLLLIVLLMRFLGLVVLVRDGRQFD